MPLRELLKNPLTEWLYCGFGNRNVVKERTLPAVWLILFKTYLESDSRQSGTLSKLRQT